MYKGSAATAAPSFMFIQHLNCNNSDMCLFLLSAAQCLEISGMECLDNCFVSAVKLGTDCSHCHEADRASLAPN